jgi:hypothetical protein
VGEGGLGRDERDRRADERDECAAEADGRGETDQPEVDAGGEPTRNKVGDDADETAADDEPDRVLSAHCAVLRPLPEANRRPRCLLWVAAEATPFRYGFAVDTDTLIEEWLTLPDVAERLGIDIQKVRQLVRDRRVLAVRRGEPPRLEIPAAFFTGSEVLKGLPGLLTVLADAGFDDAEAMRWLFTPDDSLPGSPVQALTENRGTEAKRRAQALAL